ncbi:hypothetical protein [Psychromonas hadalis]|uniref:hypothetical protein n=1 Tax=Psychromonas hadalis TaxID=211669 RepID=UPI0003B3893C|nr:hypothetical protein [Psychromonas hadalis]
MIVARWTIDAKFGHKPDVLNSLKGWFEQFGSQIGWNKGKYRILVGSIGALESQVISEITLDNLSELDESWKKLGELSGHKQWSKELEAHIVSGTQKWEIFSVET